MNKKIRLSRKTLKIILAICLTAAVAITAGFFIYIYVVDKYYWAGQSGSISRKIFRTYCR